MDTDKLYAEAIANEYAVKETTKVVALKKLDAKAKLPATVFAYVFGIVSALVLGVGMCLSMGVIGEGSAWVTAVGVGVGLLGIAGAGMNYPVYKRIMEKGKKKYGADTVRLAKEISDEEE